MTYNLMNLVFLMPVVALALLFRRLVPKRTILWTALAVLTATAIFDNYIIGTEIVAYQESAISGLRIGLAPVEDFGYAIAAILGLPVLYEWLALRVGRNRGD